MRGVSGIIIIQGAPGGETTGQAGGCIRIRPKRLRMAQVVSRTIRPSYRPTVFLGLSHGHMGLHSGAPYHTVHTLHTLHTSAHRLNWPSGVLPARSQPRFQFQSVGPLKVHARCGHSIQSVENLSVCVLLLVGTYTLSDATRVVVVNPRSATVRLYDRTSESSAHKWRWRHSCRLVDHSTSRMPQRQSVCARMCNQNGIILSPGCAVVEDILSAN